MLATNDVRMSHKKKTIGPTFFLVNTAGRIL